ncbi:MAG: efflux RND transporter periplasmic adaptor subunit [Candidatus Binataceae bacterium]|nr:efflux RND transporter periplasmic adaptor subunit [Candidatus Binataceae bacterium]
MKRIVLLFALVLMACTRSRSTNDNRPMVDPIPEVDVVRVVSQKLEATERLPAELAPWEQVAIYPKVQGFVEAIPVDRGSIVRRGQLLVRLSAPELGAQTAQARATLSGDKATYERLRVASRTPGAVSTNELELAQALFKADQAKANSLETLASYLVGVAPFDGIITERNVHPGALVGPPSEPLQSAVPMLRIEQVSHLRLIVPVPEADASAVAEGTKVEFQVSAWPGRYFTGTISRVSHWVDAKTRTMAVEADVFQATPVLDPGMFAEVMWPLRGEAPSLFVPASAVVESAEATFVERVRQGKVERVSVRRGSTMSDLVEVFGSLNAGDPVVVRGSEELANGTRVIPHSPKS